MRNHIHRLRIFGYGCIVRVHHVLAHFFESRCALHKNLVSRRGLASLQAYVHVLLWRVWHCVATEFSVWITHKHISKRVSESMILASENEGFRVIWHDRILREWVSVVGDVVGDKVSQNCLRDSCRGLADGAVDKPTSRRAVYFSQSHGSSFFTH